ncbi:DUF3300 domain-containing protein [Spirosoma pollinicola]|uniref:DUF3300 domain-containing protein n=1 Tax=Spirosoma pollinicola TaxID=2057025 RepID=UPI0012FD2213|nr:DUF3300 domain-containing protein [Spirosoma pollinicola]
MKTFIQSITAKALLLSLGLLAAGWQPTLAQNAQFGQQQPVNNTDQSLFSTIAPYRDDVRQSVLLASQQPQVLSGLAQQRAASEQGFSTIIQGYGQTKQGWFYDIARYPDLLHTLATMPTNASESEIKTLAKSLPTDSQESTWKLYRHHHDDLVQVDNLNQQAQQGFERLIAPLDNQTQQAFRQLIEMPDVMTTLTDQPDKTAQLADAYRNNPDQVTQDLASLHDRLDAQNKQELADYQNQLNNDPQAKQELQQAGQAYARANGYNTNGINPNPAWTNTSNYYQNPYPFWFGYPYWYTSAMWYPSAWWYGTGFYYGLGGNMMVFGLPSYGFSNWFFSGGHYAYPHLYGQYNRYYSHYSGINRGYNPANAGFMSAANRAFGLSRGISSSRGNWVTSGRQFNPSNGGFSGGRVAAPSTNFGGSRSQSWGGGGTRSFGGGGGFGGGFHGGGGGFHGGGGRR